MKRQRGRGRKPGGGGGSGGGGGNHHYNNNQPNRTLESNGPETKVRGPASHIFERYLQLARDAASSGDRVLSENYLQHADHYFRLVRSMQPANPAPQQHQQQQQHQHQQSGADRYGNEAEFEGGDEGAGNDADAGNEAETSGEAGGNAEQGDGESGQQQQQFADGDPRRRRGRRTRFRPDGEREGGGEPREGGNSERSHADPVQAREQREPREPRRERAPREEPAGPEGFSNGPKPAFLRGGD